jgi:DNA-binding GntR family transcriptional regulator
VKESSALYRRTERCGSAVGYYSRRLNYRCRLDQRAASAFCINHWNHSKARSLIHSSFAAEPEQSILGTDIWFMPQTFIWSGEVYLKPRNEDTFGVEETVTSKTVRKIRDAILEEVFKPGDWLPEAEIGRKFGVSRSPIREALLTLENEGTVVIEPYRGAMVKPLSAEEIREIAELRLPLIDLAAKAAYHYLSPDDFDKAYALAKQTTECKNAVKLFEYNRRFWDLIFDESRRPIRWRMFRQLDDQFARYYPLFLRLFPNPALRPRQREHLVESFRKGEIATGTKAFKKDYYEIVNRLIEYLEPGEESAP